MSDSQSNELVCKLTEKEQAERMQMLKKEVFSKTEAIVELEDGYGYIFNQNEFFTQKLLQFVNFERECCPFFTFSLIFEPNNGPVQLSIYGSEEIKAMLKSFIKESNMQGLIKR